MLPFRPNALTTTADDLFTLWGSCPEIVEISQRMLFLSLHLKLNFIHISKIQAQLNDGWSWNMSRKYILNFFHKTLPLTSK